MSTHRTSPTAEVSIPTELPPLPAEGKARLRKLIGFLRELPPEKFNFRNVLTERDHGCATVACAIGWLPAVFPKSLRWQAFSVKLRGNHQVNLAHSSFLVAAEFLQLPGETAFALFAPHFQKDVHHSLPACCGSATAIQVADMLEQFIRLTETPKLAELTPGHVVSWQSTQPEVYPTPRV
jgi:hypothetical protein